MRRAVAGQLGLAAAPVRDFDGSIVVPKPSGIAVQDTAWIQAAHDLLGANGGRVRLWDGTYVLNPAASPALNFTKPIHLEGVAGADALWANYGTRLTLDHATAVAIKLACHNVKLENFAVQNVHATAPSAGAGIQTVSGGGNSTRYGDNLTVRGFYYNVDHQAGAEWSMADSFISYDFAHAGLRIQNVDSVDGGDMAVSGQFIAGPVNNGQAGILYLSGGGFRGSRIKVNVRGTATLIVGIDMELQDGVVTGDMLLADSSIENCTWGFLLEHAGPSNTGSFQNVLIQGCEFETLGGSPTVCIAIAPAVTGKVSKVIVANNILIGEGSGQTGLLFQKIDNAVHGPNVFQGFSSNYHDGGGNTNILSVGNG